jgi:hypothetical protein
MAADDLTSEIADVARTWVASSTLQLREIARSWLAAPELHALVESFDTLDRGLANNPDALRAWSGRHLDTRQYAERREARAATIPNSIRSLLIEAAKGLGLLATSDAAVGNYRAIVILGGATTGNALRTELAARIAQKTTGWTLVGLSSDRALTPAEHRSDPDSEGDRLEWVNLLRQIRIHFGPLSEDSGQAGTGELGFATPDGQKVRLLIAPRDNQGRRPTTAHQLDFFCRRTPASNRDSVLLVTNAIYAPYQFFAGAHVLLANASKRVELIGTDTAVDTNQELLYQRIAQEIHSAILAATDIVISE